MDVQAMEQEIKNLKERLFLSEKRFEIAKQISDVTVFEYDIVTKKIITQQYDKELFGMPGVIEQGVEEVLSLGIIAKRSEADIRHLYQRIDQGEASAKATIYANDLEGNERVLELALISICNQENQPVYAIGVRRDITDLRMLKREREYQKVLQENTILVYEANVTQNRVTCFNEEWMEWMDMSDEDYAKNNVGTAYEIASEPFQKVDLFHHISKESVIDAYQEGKRVLSYQAMLRLPGKEYEWYEKTMHIIKDELTGDINVRCYIKNIHMEKEKEKKAAEEQRLYESMVSKADATYEFNLSQNVVLEGYNYLHELYEIERTDHYQKLIEHIMIRMIHPGEKEIFAAMYCRKAMLAAFADGKREMYSEYRRLNREGQFVWVKSTIPLFEDPVNGDIKGYNYINIIDEQKKEQLALIYKSQRDALTGCYNKATLEEKIMEFLSLTDKKVKEHAFLILDLDYFKDINDHFGHAFGDAFLSQTAAKIKAVFREDDLIGRIGGDEFVIFLKNAADESVIKAKAAELCSSISESYTKNGVHYHVSASIGIAIYQKHGRSYRELYHNSDMALYYAKEHGRSQYAIYNSTMQFGSTNIRAIDEHRLQQPKTINENISDYVFRILYEAVDKEEAIQTVLELIGKHFGVSRVYIFEHSEDGKYLKYTFEWCHTGVESQREKLRLQPIGVRGDYSRYFNTEGYFYLPSIEQAPPEIYELLHQQGITSMLQFAIEKDGRFAAFLGFDQCNGLSMPKQEEISDYRNMANVIGIFLTEMRAIQWAVRAGLKSESLKKAAKSVVNGLDSYAYVCDPVTHNMLFINSNLHHLIPEAKLGDVCSEVFWDSKTTCLECPLNRIVETKTEHQTIERYNKKLGKWMKISASWIEWLDGERTCLVEVVDITKYMQKGRVE